MKTEGSLQSFMRAFFQMATLCLLAACSHAQSASWVGTWSTAPMRGSADAHLVGMTLRQVVCTSVAGNQLRIQISNQFGEQPLHIEDVHIALSGSTTSIVAGSDHPLRFSGQSSVVIAPGSFVLSDAVFMKIPALTHLAISFYLASQVGSITFHSSAHQTSYTAPGDVSVQADLHGAKQVDGIYFLTHVDIRGSHLRGAIVTLGASITEGYAASDNIANRWTDVLAQRLAQAGVNIGVLNAGISGNRLLTEGAGPDAVDRFERDVLHQPGVRWVIFSDDPINDLGSTRPAPSAAALISATHQLIVKAHSRHIQFFCSTLTPYQGANYWRPEDEAARELFNVYVRNSKNGCDGVIDQDAATHDPARPTWYLPAYDSGDHLHPNDAGHKAIASAVNLSLFTDSPAHRLAQKKMRVEGH
jgi:lysophospholipase L1-like esterase